MRKMKAMKGYLVPHVSITSITTRILTRIKIFTGKKGIKQEKQNRISNNYKLW